MHARFLQVAASPHRGVEAGPNPMFTRHYTCTCRVVLVYIYSQNTYINPHKHLLSHRWLIQLYHVPFQLGSLAVVRPHNMLSCTYIHNIMYNYIIHMYYTYIHIIHTYVHIRHTYVLYIHTYYTYIRIVHTYINIMHVLLANTSSNAELHYRSKCHNRLFGKQ